MKTITWILYGLFFFCLVSGVLAVIPLDLPGVTVYIIDIVVLLSVPVTLLLFYMRGGFSFTDTWVQAGVSFFLIASISLVFSPVVLSSQERLSAELYLLRWVAYASVLSLTLVVIRLQYITKQQIIFSLKVTSLFLALLGWLQYFLYPNLRNLQYLGWDPHFERIFSTYLDPNYFGLSLMLGLILFYVPVLQKKERLTVPSAIAIFFLLLTLFFTYSRSSYLTLLSLMFFLSLVQRQWKTVAVGAGCIILAVLLLPRPEGEGGQFFRLYSVFSRTANWESGVDIIRNHPLLGVGFNTLRAVKQQTGDVTARQEGNHAGAGIDNSLIFVAATTGLIGLLVFLFLLRVCYLELRLEGRTSLLAVVIHSMFQNSLFYPWIMLWLWIVLAVFRTRRNQEE